MLKKIIFLIDDDKDILETLKECLQKEFNEIMTFDNPEEAVIASKTLKPDVIIIDANLNGVSGLSLIKRFDPSIAKHLFSGTHYKETPEGFTSVLNKPCGIDELMKLVS